MRVRWKQGVGGFVRLGWLALGSAVLVQYWGRMESWSNGENQLLFFTQLMLLTFPVGFSAILPVIFPAVFIESTSNPLEYPIPVMATWCLPVAGGYLQWFVLVPKINRNVSAWVKGRWKGE